MQAVDNGLSDGATRPWKPRRWSRGRQGEQRNALRTPIDRGLTAPPAYTPFGGYARLDRLVKGLDSADRRSAIWAAVLWATSIGAVTALWFDGYRVPHVWALFVLGAIAAAADRQTVKVN